MPLSLCPALPQLQIGNRAPFCKGEGRVLGEWFWVSSSCLCVHTAPLLTPGSTCSSRRPWALRAVPTLPPPASQGGAGPFSLPASHPLDSVILPSQPPQLWPTGVYYFVLWFSETFSSISIGLAKKFIWLFHKHLTENPE